jgi:hypothetical protein
MRAATLDSMFSSVVRGVGGVVLVGLVVWLGLETAEPYPKPLIVAVFGIAAALLGPTAISLLGGAFTSKRDEAMKRFAEAGEVEQKIAQAKTTEEKLRALQEERRRIDAIVRLEARRAVARDRRGTLNAQVSQLTEQADKLLAELEALKREESLLSEEIDHGLARSEIMATRSRLLPLSGDPVDRLINRFAGSLPGPAVEDIYTQLSSLESMVPFARFWIRFFARIAMFFVNVFDIMEAQDLKEKERRKEKKELKRRKRELKRSGSSSEGGGSEDSNIDDK